MKALEAYVMAVAVTIIRRSRKLAGMVVVLHAVFCGAAAAGTVNILWDTDIGGDCDDAGAAAVLHAFRQTGEAKILGMACSTSNPWGAPCLDAINTYYGMPDIPVGTYKKPGFYENDIIYNKDIAQNWPNDLKNGKNAPDAVKMYRRILARQPDHSVTFVATGSLNNLSNLLNSAPDEYSPMTGRALIAAKVIQLSDMGGWYPTVPKDWGPETNFKMDCAATKDVVENWPTPIVFTGAELGYAINSGHRLSKETAADNPVRRAYERYVGVGNDRPSWDLLAMLYAVRGLGKYFDAVTTGSIDLRAEDAFNSWMATPDSDRSYLKAKMYTADIGAELDDLMVSAGAGGLLKTAAPRFSPEPAKYSAQQSVVITSDTPEADSRYTTDGSRPTTTNGTLYTGPITIADTVTIKAIAYKEGRAASMPSTAVYVIGTDTTDDHSGTISARGDNPSNEQKSKAFDDSITSKWLDRSPEANRASWIQYQYAKGAGVAVSSYTITSANDCPERDPADWTLKGSNDGTTWMTLDTRTGQIFPRRLMKIAYNIAKPAPYRMYRLCISTVFNPKTANSVQLAEIELLKK